MARFRAVLSDNASAGTTSKLGRQDLMATVNGWDRGVEVVAFVDKATGLDTFEVYKTGGSNGGARRELLARFI